MDEAVVNYFVDQSDAEGCAVDAGHYQMILLSSLREIAMTKSKNGFIRCNATKKKKVLETVYYLLDDSSDYVKGECLRILSAIIPQLGENVDFNMPMICKKVICNIGHQKKGIQSGTVEVLFRYLRNTNNLQNFLKTYVKYGIESENLDIRKTSLSAVKLLFTSEIANENLFLLVRSLANQLIQREPYLFQSTFQALYYLHTLIGDDTFHRYMDQVGKDALNLYQNTFCTQASKQNNFITYSPMDRKNIPASRKVRKLEFAYGIFESSILDKIKHDDWQLRHDGVDLIRVIIQDTKDLFPLLPFVRDFLASLSVLLSDPHPKVISTTLDTYEILINKLEKKDLADYLRTLVTTLTINLGNKKIIREKTVKIMLKLMRKHQPMPLLKILLEQRKNRNPRIREEIINRVMAALLHFPSYLFDLTFLCNMVTPALADKVSRVKMAALECIIVLASVLGDEKKQELISAVEKFKCTDVENILSLVEERVKSKQLPGCGDDGVMHYAYEWPPRRPKSAPHPPCKRLQSAFSFKQKKVSEDLLTDEEKDTDESRDGRGDIFNSLSYRDGSSPDSIVDHLPSSKVINEPVREKYRIRAFSEPCVISEEKVSPLEGKEPQNNFISLISQPPCENSSPDEGILEGAKASKVVRIIPDDSSKQLFIRSCCRMHKGGCSKGQRCLHSPGSDALFDDDVGCQTPYLNPEEEFENSLRFLNTDDWQEKKKAMAILIRLSKFHPQVLINDLHLIALKLNDEAKSLRSVLSRAAILTLGEMAKALKKAMEPEMQPVVATLLQKAGNKVTGWMRSEIERTLAIIIEGMSPQRAAVAIIAGGANNRNKDVRESAAKLLSDIVERLGAQRCLAGHGNLTAELLPSAANFLTDNSPITRYYGRKIFNVLVTCRDFNKVICRYLQHHVICNINKILECIKEQGPGPVPKELMTKR